MAKKSVAKRSAAKTSAAASTRASDRKADAAEAAKPKMTTSTNKALSISDGAKARADFSDTNRWATLKETDGIFDKDARKEVINISIMDPNFPPEVSAELLEEGNKNGAKYTVQQVGAGVTIGMREGGAFESADGFGWRDPEDKVARGSPAGSGSTRLADVGAA